MENTFDLSVILPINTSKVKDFETFFLKSIDSIKTQRVKPRELVIVHTQEESLVNFLSNVDFSGLEVKKVLYKGEDNYSSQITKMIIAGDYSIFLPPPPPLVTFASTTFYQKLNSL